MSQRVIRILGVLGIVGVVSIVSLSLCACNSENKVGASTETVEIEEVGNIGEVKTYTLKTEDTSLESKVVSEITLDKQDKSFSLYYDKNSEYTSNGSYTEGEYSGKVYLKNEDGKEYVFDKVDNNTLKFDKDSSSTLSIIDENITPSLEDGAEFVSE